MDSQTHCCIVIVYWVWKLSSLCYYFLTFTFINIDSDIIIMIICGIEYNLRNKNCSFQLTYFNPLKGGSIEGRHEVNLPRPRLQKMKKLLIMRDPRDSFFPEGKNSQDL